MDKSKPIQDIEDLKLEMQLIDKKFDSFYYNMLAVAMDYKSYIDPRIKNDSIYKIRNNIIFRLNGAKYHFEILNNIVANLDSELTTAHRKVQQKGNLFGADIILDQRILQVSYLSDSFFFHLGSGFDYISKLVEFVYSHNKDAEWKWTQLARASRDEKNQFNKTSIASTIDLLDREFIGKLYDHRSHLIHSKIDTSPSSFTINILEANCKAQIFSSQDFNRNFKELKTIAKERNLTIRYSLLWVFNKSLTSLNTILFSLKEYMENNKKTDKLPMFIEGPNKEILPVSIKYWNKPNE
ncbi:MAG: hypothetical protein AMQ74_01904 [Candidatus Methanofastidiosum methylothiophilum]|uniref:Cthe-2314-like HEPN domain-containing protein n=1 Tax=Candidatus Methanofastidiosum methylothiophilum TaxID=1705564 RepID=A0A150IJX8_9EURY|nr:MAG: hypothetical protein AMQ74_01904 [Candidatus Methanofastidiosum methylthiophilus]